MPHAARPWRSVKKNPYWLTGAPVDPDDARDHVFSSARSRRDGESHGDFCLPKLRAKLRYAWHAGPIPMMHPDVRAEDSDGRAHAR